MTDQRHKGRVTTVTFGLEKFSGHKGDFVTWKDKVLTHIAQQDQVYMRGLLEKDHPEAEVLMTDFLESTPPTPDEVANGDDDALRKKKRWDKAHWERGMKDMQNLMNQCLPNSFIAGLPDSVSAMEPCEIWKTLERSYGLGDVGGLIEHMKDWNRIKTSNWKDLRLLFSHLKKVRNDMNRKTNELIKSEMVSETWLCVEVLSQLPSELWASSISLREGLFTIESVESSLKTIFGDRSKAEISSRLDSKGSVSINHVKAQVKNPDSRGQKRKTAPTPQASVNSACHYCLNIGHMKAKCPQMAEDRNPNRPGGPMFRSSINHPVSRKVPGSAVQKINTAVVRDAKRVKLAKTELFESEPESDEDLEPPRSNDLDGIGDGDLAEHDFSTLELDML